MDRHWLLTNTCYGTRLPGSARGFVSHVLDHRPIDPAGDRRVVHGMPDTPYDEEIPGLESAAQAQMRGPPVHLQTEHAEALLIQFLETAQHRKWLIRAVAIMFNHFHVVVGVQNDPSPSKVLSDFKS